LRGEGERDSLRGGRRGGRSKKYAGTVEKKGIKGRVREGQKKKGGKKRKSFRFDET